MAARGGVSYAFELLVLSLATAQAAYLQPWADASGIERSCAVGRSPVHGCRGLVAKRGEPVLRVPSQLTISVAREQEGDDAHRGDWLTHLSLRLAEEMQAGPSSPHAAFVRSLPAPPHGPHRWRTEELDSLQNATLVREAHKRAELRRESFARVAGRTDVPRQTYERAWELVASRAVGARGVRGLRGERLLLVPYLDMANHAHGVGGQLSFDPRSGDVTLLAGTDLEAGDEVLLDYGEGRCNSEFLLQYGFVPSHNPHDRTTVQLANGATETIGWGDARTAAPEVRAACERTLSEMPTSLAEDAAELAGGGARGTHAVALGYRVAKKALLSAVAGHAASSAATSAFALM